MQTKAEYNYIRPLGKKPIQLSLQEAKEYSTSRDILALLWEVEDLFETSVSALLSLEQTLLLDALNYSVLGHITDGQPTETRATLNSKLGNLLFSGRAYEELSRAKIRKRLPEVEQALAAIYSKAFDNCLEYRLMYALRNSMTHGDSTILSISFGGRRESLNYGGTRDASRSHNVIEPTLKIADLLEMPKLKCGVKPLIKANFSEYDRIDLRIFWRRFFSILASVHQNFRNLTSDLYGENMAILQEAALKHTGQNDWNRGIVLQDCLEADLSRCLPFDTSHFRYIERQRRKFVSLQYFHRFYVSNGVSHNQGCVTHSDDTKDLLVPRE